jgi:hypothetical protein
MAPVVLYGITTYCFEVLGNEVIELPLVQWVHRLSEHIRQVIKDNVNPDKKNGNYDIMLVDDEQKSYIQSLDNLNLVGLLNIASYLNIDEDQVSTLDRTLNIINQEGVSCNFTFNCIETNNKKILTSFGEKIVMVLGIEAKSTMHLFLPNQLDSHLKDYIIEIETDDESKVNVTLISPLNPRYDDIYCNY